ncbi:MAG: hypothetical protein OXR82_05445 [Gammaproteobacteria bacterium]|nr:hypothetical protein [Gammaproteobacteria bacterium]MDE0257819.1 hypothetical protein [Gammaproteobacteria bacterium]
MRRLMLVVALAGCEDAPDLDPERAVSDETVARLSRDLSQQERFLDADRALWLLAQAGQKGADAIMSLDRAGTVNEDVYRLVRTGGSEIEELCAQVPEFTACKQFACRRELGWLGIGTMQFSCRDFYRIRCAFRPEELAGAFEGCREEILREEALRFLRYGRDSVASMPDRKPYR